MEDVFAAQDRMTDQSAQKVLEHALSAGDDSRVLLGFRLAFDRIVGQRLLARYWRDDQYRVQARQGLMQLQKGGISATRGMRSQSYHIGDIASLSPFCGLERIDNADLLALVDIPVAIAAESFFGFGAGE